MREHMQILERKVSECAGLSGMARQRDAVPAASVSVSQIPATIHVLGSGYCLCVLPELPQP